MTAVLMKCMVLNLVGLGLIGLVGKEKPQRVPKECVGCLLENE
jgi:hypothetical protein